MFTQGMYLWNIVWNIFSESFVADKRYCPGLYCSFAHSFPVQLLEKLWGKCKILISISLFFICMACIRTRVIKVVIPLPFHPLLYFFLIKYLLIYSAYNNAERRKHSHNTYVNFVLSLDQAVVLAMSCLRTKRGRKSSPCHVHAIWILHNIPVIVKTVSRWVCS